MKRIFLSVLALLAFAFCAVFFPDDAAMLAVVIAWPIAPALQTRALFGFAGSTQLGYRNARKPFDKTAVRYGGAASPILCGRRGALPSGRSVGQIVMISGGTLYNGTETVTIQPPSPGGIQATGTLIIAAGVVTGVLITNPGTGYTSVPVVTIDVSGGGGGPAVAAAVMAGATQYPHPFPTA